MNHKEVNKIDGLYDDQAACVDEFTKWLEGTSTFCGLWASAGFGKSHLVKYLITLTKQLFPDLNITLTSMTHSAVEVLEELTNVPTCTTHSAMGWVPAFNTKTGEEYIKVPNKPRLTSSTLLIVDEAGLLGIEETELLVAQAIKQDARVLFVGDNKQCFPVDKKGRYCIPAYDVEQVKLFLTIPKRVDVNDMIYALSIRYRAAVDGGRQPKLRTLPNPNNPNRGVFVSDDIEESAYDLFRQARDLDEGQDNKHVREVKVLAFTNNRVVSLNRKIRKKVFGITDPAPFIGEELVANASLQNPLPDVNEALLKNNQLVVVEGVEPDELYGIKGNWLDLVDVEVPVFVASNFADKKKRMDALESKISQLEGKCELLETLQTKK